MILSKKRAEEIGREVLQEFAAEAIEKARPRPVTGVCVDEFGYSMEPPSCPRCDGFLGKVCEAPESLAEGFISINDKSESSLGWIDGPKYQLHWAWSYCPFCGQKLEWPGLNGLDGDETSE